MLDWPCFALVITPVIGIVVLLLNRILGNEKIFHTQWKTVLFILTATTFQVAILGRDYWGVSASGLFRLDGMNTHLLFCFLIFSLLNHISLRFDRCQFETETGILQLAFVLSGIIFIMANNLILYVLAAPMTFLIAGAAPLFNVETPKGKGFRIAVMSAMIVMFLFAFSAALIGQAADTLELGEIGQALLVAQKSPQFIIGWSLHILMCISMMLLPPMALFLTRYEHSESWSLIGFFRMSLPLLGVILFSKWIFITGFQWEITGSFTSILSLSAAHISGVLSCAVSVITILALLNTERVLLFSQLTLTAGLFSALLSTSLIGPEGLLISQSTIYIFVFCSSLLHLTFATLNISTQATLKDLGDALQKSSVSIQLGCLFALLGSAPFLTYVGYDLNKKLIERAKLILDIEGVTSLLALIFTALITIIICNRIVELYFGNARRNSVWDDRGFAAKIWNYTLMAIVLILGIYPTPLYKYLSHSINLFVKNAS